MDIAKFSLVQFKLASMLAYYTLHYHWVKPNEKEGARKAMMAAEHACILAGINDLDCFAIREGKFKGLQNLNKLSGVVKFEHDYYFSTTSNPKVAAY